MTTKQKKVAKVASDPIEHYVMNNEDLEEVKIVVKNNTILGMEEFGSDGLSLSGTDVQVLSTALLAVHIIKEKRQTFDANTRFTIPFKLFVGMWGIDNNEKSKPSVNFYRDLRRSISRLNSRKFRYPSAYGPALAESGYFAFIEYENARISFGFPLTIIEYLNKNNDFTWYFLENVLKIQQEGGSSVLRNYAQIIYENLHKVKNFTDLKNKKGEVVIKFSTTKLRRLLGIEPSNYSRHIDFRVKVLDKIVQLLQEKIGLAVSVENIYSGRSVVGYQFVVKFAEQDLDFSRAVTKNKIDKPIMTIAQRRKYAALLVKHPVFDLHFRRLGESDEDFTHRIIGNLMHNDRVSDYADYLKEQGFVSKKLVAYQKERKAEQISDAEKEQEIKDIKADLDELHGVQADKDELRDVQADLDAIGYGADAEEAAGADLVVAKPPAKRGRKKTKPDADPEEMELPF